MSTANRDRLLAAGPLYALTPATWPVHRLLPALAEALLGGVRLVQWRRKGDGIDPDAGLAEARRLAAQHDALFIVNDSPERAAACAADGVHLGKSDGELSRARALLGPGALVGASCYAALSRAEAAVQAGADHVAFGALFSSVTKPGAVRCPPELVREARQTLTVPVCVIGGIDLDNVAAARATQAQLYAVVDGLFGADDIRERARQLMHGLGGIPPAS